MVKVLNKSMITLYKDFLPDVEEISWKKYFGSII
jgi:hypothetical protein